MMKEILKKYVNGQCTADEFKKAVIVLAGLARQGTLHDFMDKHWKDYTGEKAEGNPERFNHLLNQVHHEINIFEEKTPFTRKLYLTFSKVAAVLLLPLVTVLTLFVYQNQGVDQVAMIKMSTPAGIQSHIELPDGSHVWLNSESEIHFPATFDEQENRQIKLIGEGYFEVASNKKKPFVVSAGNELVVLVSGTSFNLSAYENEPEVAVALLEGGVRLQREATDDSNVLAKMEPGDVARFNKSSQELRVAHEINMEPYVAWKEGRCVFYNEPFESVLRTMERKFNVKYKIEDSRLLEYRITATFIDETLEEFLKIITTSSPVEYEIQRPDEKGEINFLKKRVVILTKK
jgi:ferric-dicitrate binding protein FerR (iron transport regulator)